MMLNLRSNSNRLAFLIINPVAILAALAACLSPEERARIIEQQRILRAEQLADVRFALEQFADEGSRNRVFVDAERSELKQLGYEFVQSVNAIPAEQEPYDLILKIETESERECRFEALGGVGRASSSSGDSGYAHASVYLMKLAGIGNSLTILFASEASDCSWFVEPAALERAAATVALANFAAPPCSSASDDLRPYYFRCRDTAGTAVAADVRQGRPYANTERLTRWIRASMEANRLARVRIDAPQHLLAKAADFVNTIGATPVVDGPAEFILRLQRGERHRCRDGQRPVAIFVAFTTAGGDVLASEQAQACTALFTNDAERRLVGTTLAALSGAS
jgi:hypothetical protein